MSFKEKIDDLIKEEVSQQVNTLSNLRLQQSDSTSPSSGQVITAAGTQLTVVLPNGTTTVVSLLSNRPVGPGSTVALPGSGTAL